jgi:tRNA(Ile)-lysidine synthase
LQDLAKLDATQCVSGDCLDCRCLASLSLPRARNLLRWFIEQHGLRMPNERRLEEGLRQLLHAVDDARVRVAMDPGIELRRYRSGAYLVPVRACAQQAAVRWQGEPTLHLEQAGWEIAFNRVHGAGLSLAKLDAAHVELGVRQGGERMRLVGNSVHRSLKNLLQEAALPPWQRACMPLLRCDGQLAWANGIGFDADYRASAEEPGIVPLCRASAITQ